jgi:hypothetical protein
MQHLICKRVRIPDIRKLFTAIHALNQVSFAYGYTNVQAIPVVKEISPIIRQNLLAILQNKTTPLEDVYEACDEGLKAFDFRSDDCIQTYSMIEATLFTNWPESTSLLVKGGAYIDMAWNARGGGYAKTVTPEGWITFVKDLVIAEDALNRAWTLNTNDVRIANKMMTMELGQGQGRARMELWFRRAMKIDPNDFEACNAKLLYLDPKWHGSVQEMLNFGRECVLNTNWGGRIPLILVDAHNSIYNQYIDKSEKTNYWKQPEVWHEVKAAYDRFFILNPKDTDFYKFYASHAYDAEQWASFVEIAQKIPARDYYYFSGKDYFDSMVQAANRMIRYNRRHGIVTPQ